MFTHSSWYIISLLLDVLVQFQNSSKLVSKASLMKWDGLLLRTWELWRNFRGHYPQLCAYLFFLFFFFGKYFSTISQEHTKFSVIILYTNMLTMFWTFVVIITTPNKQPFCSLCADLWWRRRSNVVFLVDYKGLVIETKLQDLCSLTTRARPQPLTPQPK